MNNYKTEVKQSSELDLFELIEVIWSKKLKILGASLFGIILSFVLIGLLNKEYTSNIILAPAFDETSQGMGLNTQELGGLASLAGFNLNQNQVDPSQLALSVLTSRKFLTEFIKRNNMAPLLLAASSYDEESESYVFDEEIYDPEVGEWKIRSLEDETYRNLQAYKKLFSMIEFERLPESGLFNLELTTLSSSDSRDWLGKLVESLNLEMKRRDIDEARRSIDFIEEQLQENALSEVRSVLFRLIEEQTRTLMFADVREEYAFEIVDPPVASVEPSYPRRLIVVVVIGFFIGLMTTMILIIKHYYQLRKLEQIRD